MAHETFSSCTFETGPLLVLLLVRFAPALILLAPFISFFSYLSHQCALEYSSVLHFLRGVSSFTTRAYGRSPLCTPATSRQVVSTAGTALVASPDWWWLVRMFDRSCEGEGKGEGKGRGKRWAMRGWSEWSVVQATGLSTTPTQEKLSATSEEKNRARNRSKASGENVRKTEHSRGRE